MLMHGDMSASLECMNLLRPTMQVPSATTRAPIALDYTTVQLESARTNLEVFAKEVR